MAVASLSGLPFTTLEPRLTDSHGRVIHDLRVSITDRCNYKCVYCRTGEVGAQYPELQIDEYLRLIRVFVGLGISKVRLTGGEPLLRRGLVDMVKELATWRTHRGRTAGSGAHHQRTSAGRTGCAAQSSGAEPCHREHGRCGRGHVRTDHPHSREVSKRCCAAFVLREAAGLTPLKINCVLLRGFNDDQVEGFARFAREEDVVVRFIEFMPLEEGRLWTPEIVVTLKEIVERIGRVLPLVEMPAREASETARRYTFADGVGEIGIIAPVSQAFCGACSRVRLTSDGKIRTCLFSQVEHDLYGRLRAGADDEELRDYIVRTVKGKEARHHIGEPGFLKPSRSMVHIGG